MPKSTFVFRIREADRITRIIDHRVEAESGHDVAHLRETEVLTIELPQVAIIDFSDHSFSLGEYPTLRIEEIDLPEDTILMRIHRKSLEDRLAR